MWLKKLLKGDKGEKEQQRQQKQEPMEQQETVKESRVYTATQEEVDLRYSNLKIINSKSLHLPQHSVHFIESTFFSQRLLLQGRLKHTDEWTPLQDVVVTDRQLLLSPDLFALRSKRSTNANNVLHVYYGMIERMELINSKKETLKLQFTLKDNRVFLLQCVMADKLTEIDRLIREFGFPNAINKFYAFKYGKVPKKIDGWKLYNFWKEMQRQGVSAFTWDPTRQSSPLPAHAYQVIINKDFQISPTYPKQLVVPIALSMPEVINCSRFRTKERLPILTYFYQYKPGAYASLFRCSQIKSGILSARSEEDEKMIREIARSSETVSESKQQRGGDVNCKVFDARGFYAALGNKFAGKGFEHAQTYACQVQFLNIPNIHAVRDSYNKIRSNWGEQKEFLQVVGESGWIDYLFLILAGARSMAKTLQAGKNVVVHCSDGWDRTSQLSALAQLLLDPYYRTLNGFIVLVEKDWRQCGHKFRERSGQYNHKDYREHQKSPVFIQFLDCVVQVISQFPLSFEFNSRLLCFLASAYQSYTYGTFLTNNLKQATELHLEANTVSVWSDVLERREEFINPFYSAQGPRVLEISVESKDFVIWREWLVEQYSTRDEQWNILRRQFEINSNLKQNIHNYQQEIEKLRQRLKAKN